jgi:hypothetical protein
MKNYRRIVLTILILFSLATVYGFGQEGPEVGAPPAPQQQDNQATRNDPPDRAARLQYLSGSVSIQPQGTGDWVSGTQNSTLTNSDNVWTDKDSKAELNVGGGLLRMGDESSLTLTNISSQNVQVELHQGTLSLHVRQLFGGEIYEVDTPNMAFTVQKSGDYRFDVDPNEDTTVVTVRKGEGDATGNGPAVRIKSNEQARFSNSTSLEHTVAEAPPYDGFDSWCGARNDREDHSVSARYVAPGVIGYEDLDDYGVWDEVPPYGHIWVPRHVAVGWAPYHDGHWAYVEPWGWTWVDNAPWGYAPFHYGRWVYTGGYWGWAPGPVYVRPVYAPALVAWFGGPAWGVSFGFGFGGGFGWCPLGFGEPFYPWYHHGYGYFRSVNISNTYIHNVNNYYGHPPNRGSNFANYRAPGGFTAAPARTLQNGLPVARTGMHLTPNQIANAPIAHGPSVAPNRNATLGASAGRSVAMPPSRSLARPVVTRNGGLSNSGRPSGVQAASNVQRPGANSGSLAPNRNVVGAPQRTMTGSTASPTRNVPRPPSAGGTPNGSVSGRFGQTETRGNTNLGGNQQHSIPRPPANMPRPATAAPNTGHYNSAPAVQSTRSAGPSTSVPRPTGPVRPASQVNRGAGSYENRGGYGSSRYSPAPSYRGAPGYGSQTSPRYSPAPSYHASAPSNHGGYSSAPAYRGGGGSAPSYHGGGGGSAPSYHGGGGGGGSSRGGGSSGGGHSGGHR